MQSPRPDVDGGLLEAGALFAALMGCLKVIEKLVDQKMAKPAPAVQVDLKQEGLGEIIETQNAIAQTLERSNDKLDEIDRRTRETGKVTFEIRERQRVEVAKAEARREARADARERLGDQ
tara:strand:+ start:502 stop:861 length:360 start_codon:yes stop_codon:yes gene_type:complete